MELPRLQPLYEKYADQGFEILAVDGKRDTDRSKKFIEKHADRNHCLVEFTLGNALYLSGSKESCLAHYKAAEEMNPAFGPAWVNLGQVAYDLKRYGLAAEALTMGFEVAEEDEKERAGGRAGPGPAAAAQAGLIRALN